MHCFQAGAGWSVPTASQHAALFLVAEHDASERPISTFLRLWERWWTLIVDSRQFTWDAAAGHGAELIAWEAPLDLDKYSVRAQPLYDGSAALLVG